MEDEPLFMLVRDADPEFRQTITDAQNSLSKFRLLADELAGPDVYP